MAILIANIGTSDIAIKVDEYYFPVEFDRKEPNIDYSGLDADEDAAWKDRKKFIQQTVCIELGLELDRFSFREFTLKLRDAYSDNEEAWHFRIRPGRIWGAVIAAKERFQVKTVYMFVTDQPSGHDSDSVYLFDILQRWFSRQIGDAIEFKPIPIAKNVSAVDQDGLLHEYYKFFSQINKDEKLLISTKGGTYQMQTALRVQAMASDVQKQIFLEPILSVKKILAGEPSKCNQTSYWRYLRTQRYQIVKQLLERWDFDGAMQVLKKWTETLEDLMESEIQDVASSRKFTESFVNALDVAICYFNLDNVGARRIIKVNDALHPFKQIPDGYDQFLNLYTQCRVYWELNQVANFLSRMTSFCEETLNQIIIKLGGLKYFDRMNHPDDWYLDKGKVDPKLWSYFAEREEANNKDLKNWNFQRKPRYRLSGRFSKWNFVDALIKFRDKVKEREPWQNITTALDKLDYWVEKRNDLIHSAKGVSKESMSNLLEKDREDDFEVAMAACDRDQILAEMTKISRKSAELLNLSENSFVGLDARYYIYSDIKEWVINKLMTDGLL